MFTKSPQNGFFPACVDCRWYSLKWYQRLFNEDARCSHPQLVTIKTSAQSLVDYGGITRPEYGFCIDLRGNEGCNYCGMRGRFFEPKNKKYVAPLQTQETETENADGRCNETGSTEPL